MLTSSEILVTYQTLSGLMSGMLAAAREGDWDRLVEIEKNCQVSVGRLKESPATPMTLEEQRQKLDLIKRILKDDAEIRDLTMPRMAFLQQRIGLARAGRQSMHAYR